MIGLVRRPATSLAAILVSLAIWWSAAIYFKAPVGKFPSPPDVADALLAMIRSGELAENLVASLYRLIVGFAIGALLGLAVGIAMTASHAVAAFVRPLAGFFQAIAGVAWIPVAIVWFGIGTGPSLFVTANAVFFIVLFNTIAGVNAVPASLIAAVRVLGGGHLSVFREVLLPGAFVYFLVAIEIGAAFAWRALISVEIIAGTDGIGAMLNMASTRFDAASVVGLILVVGILWLVIERLTVRPLRRLTVEKWGIASVRN
jgi:NitT/TauT family transport system permease protein/taurine transport system permease protein